MTARSPEAEVRTTGSATWGWLSGVVVWLAGLLGILLILAQGTVSWLVANTFESRLLPEINRQVQLAGDLTAWQIGEAVRLGVPMGEIVGMTEYFDGVFAQNPNLRRLAVMDLDTGQVLYEGTAPTIRIAGQNLQELTLPIVVDNQPVARLQVQYQGYSAGSLLQNLQSDRVTVVVAAWLAGVMLLALFVWACIRDPFQVAQRALAIGANGDFRYLVSPHQAGEMNQFGRKFNETVQRLNIQFDETVDEVEEASAAQFDRKARERISAAVVRAQERFSFAQPLTEIIFQMSSPRGAWIPIFLFLMAQAMTWPYLPVWFETQPLTGNGAGSAFDGVGFLFGPLLVAAVVVVVGERWLRMGDPRAFFLVGTLAVITGQLGIVFSPAFAPLWIWAVLSGIGLGTVLVTGIATETWQQREARSIPVGLLTLVGSGVVAVACGAAVGGVLFSRMGVEVLLVSAAGIGGLSGVLALIFLAPVARSQLAALDVKTGADVSPADDSTVTNIIRASEMPIAGILVTGIALSFVGWMSYLVPHHVVDSGLAHSVVGRVVLVYGVVALSAFHLLLLARPQAIGSPLAILIGVGAVLATIGCSLPALFDVNVVVLFGGAMVLALSHAVFGIVIARIVSGSLNACAAAEATSVTRLPGLMVVLGLVAGAGGSLAAWGLYEKFSAQPAMVMLGGSTVICAMIAGFMHKYLTKERNSS